jgi:hypothetical protein
VWAEPHGGAAANFLTELQANLIDKAPRKTIIRLLSLVISRADSRDPKPARGVETVFPDFKESRS